MLTASVLIPTSNQHLVVVETLNSLSTQSVPPERFEVVVAVDGSTDSALHYLAEMCTAYPLRILHSQDPHPAAARELAAGQARNDVLIFLDDDQRASAGLIGAHLAAHETRGTVLVQGSHPPLKGNWSLLAETWRRLGGVAAARFRHRRGDDTSLTLGLAALKIPLVFESRALSFHLDASVRQGSLVSRKSRIAWPP